MEGFLVCCPRPRTSSNPGVEVAVRDLSSSGEDEVIAVGGEDGTSAKSSVAGNDSIGNIGDATTGGLAWVVVEGDETTGGLAWVVVEGDATTGGVEKDAGLVVCEGIVVILPLDIEVGSSQSSLGVLICSIGCENMMHHRLCQETYPQRK